MILAQVAEAPDLETIYFIVKIGKHLAWSTMLAVPTITALVMVDKGLTNLENKRKAEAKAAGIINPFGYKGEIASFTAKQKIADDEDEDEYIEEEEREESENPEEDTEDSEEYAEEPEEDNEESKEGNEERREIIY